MLKVFIYIFASFNILDRINNLAEGLAQIIKIYKSLTNTQLMYYIDLLMMSYRYFLRSPHWSPGQRHVLNLHGTLIQLHSLPAFPDPARQPPATVLLVQLMELLSNLLSSISMFMCMYRLRSLIISRQGKYLH